MPVATIWHAGAFAKGQTYPVSIVHIGRAAITALICRRLKPRCPRSCIAAFVYDYSERREWARLHRSIVTSTVGEDVWCARSGNRGVAELGHPTVSTVPSAAAPASTTGPAFPAISQSRCCSLRRNIGWLGRAPSLPPRIPRVHRGRRTTRTPEPCPPGCNVWAPCWPQDTGTPVRPGTQLDSATATTRMANGKRKARRTVWYHSTMFSSACPSPRAQLLE